MTLSELDDLNKLHNKWIDSINDKGVNLTHWEHEFMNSIYERVDRWNTTSKTQTVISDKQAEIVERIYTERVP